MAETLLDGLCRVNGQQGGTIHQFVQSDPHNELGNLMRRYAEDTSIGFTFGSRAAIEKLAQRYHVVLTWR